MGNQKQERHIIVPEGSIVTSNEYRMFLETAAELIGGFPQYFAPDEGVESLELAHMILSVPETLITLYVGLNDAVCNKAIVTPFLVRHAHKNVFVFDPAFFPGGVNVPEGCVDAREALNGFEPPNSTWSRDWTYVMIEDTSCGFEDLWHENGYIDTIAAKYEDFTMLSDPDDAGVCFFIDEGAFGHPVNAGRSYLNEARKRGDARAHEYEIPAGMEGEVDGLIPVILHRGEKLYVARPDHGPCAHAWSNIHPANAHLAVVNENSAVPLDLIVRKPVVEERYAGSLKPAGGSADMTTDWFFRGGTIVRKPILAGAVRG